MAQKLDWAGAEKVTAAEYYEQIVPKFLDAHRDQPIRSKYVFRLFGERSSRNEWTIDFGEHRVRRGGDDNFDFYLEMEDGDFRRMLTDKLDVQEALLNGRIRYEGNPQHLSLLAALLMPAEVV
jgi:putative sterol carrier protein